MRGGCTSVRQLSEGRQKVAFGRNNGSGVDFVCATSCPTCNLHCHRSAEGEQSNSSSGCIIFGQWLLFSSDGEEHPISPVTTLFPR